MAVFPAVGSGSSRVFFLSLNWKEQQNNGGSRGGGKSWAYSLLLMDAQHKNVTVSSNFMNKNKINTRLYFLTPRLENIFYINSSIKCFCSKTFYINIKF